MSSGDDGEFLIEVEPEYLRSLADWLNSEADLRGRVRAVRPAPAPGTMGAAVELLTVALGSGGAGAVLVRSICTWLGQRRSQVSVTLKDRDGREFTFTSTSRNLDSSEVFREASAIFDALGNGPGEDGPGQEQGSR